MRRNTKIISLLIVILVIGIFIYGSPNEAYWLENHQSAIECGRTYAYYLLNGDKQGLLNISIDPAKTKIKKSNIHQTTISTMDIIEKKKISFNILWPLWQEQIENDMVLTTLERLESFIVMTFAYKSWDKVVEIPGKGKMFFSVGVCYYNPIDNRIMSKLVRKIANLPLIRNFTCRMGTTGRWLVFDYSYKYNLNDYFNWILKEGENYSKKELKESMQESMQMQQILKCKKSYKKYRKKRDEYCDRGFAFLYEWGNIAVEKQIERIERRDKNKQEFEKNGELGAE